MTICISIVTSLETSVVNFQDKIPQQGSRSKMPDHDPITKSNNSIHNGF
mgnify:CR=1 FL=1